MTGTNFVISVNRFGCVDSGIRQLRSRSSLTHVPLRAGLKISGHRVVIEPDCFFLSFHDHNITILTIRRRIVGTFSRHINLKWNQVRWPANAVKSPWDNFGDSFPSFNTSKNGSIRPSSSSNSSGYANVMCSSSQRNACSNFVKQFLRRSVVCSLKTKHHKTTVLRQICVQSKLGNE